MNIGTHRLAALVPLLFLFSLANAQNLHQLPVCEPTDSATSLVWSTSPGPGEYDWLPAGALTMAAHGIQGGPQNVDVTVSGATHRLSPLVGTATPHVSSFLGPFDAISLYVANGIGLGDSIVLTFDFDPPIPGSPALDIYHINKSGGGGDQVEVFATYQSGPRIYPSISPPAQPSWNLIGPGHVDAVAASTFGDRDQVGLNFEEPGLIDRITVVWKECTTCQVRAHGLAISSFDFCVRSTPLPVEMHDFQARATETRSTALSWRVEAALPGTTYEVQRSTDNFSWKTVATTEYGATSYKHEAVDLQPETGYNAYRIKAIESDGGEFFSEIQTVQHDAPSQALKIYPNPVREQLQIVAEGFDDAEAMVIGATGRVIETLRLQPGQQSLNLSAYAPGYYLLKVGNTVERFVKQ